MEGGQSSKPSESNSPSQQQSRGGKKEQTPDGPSQPEGQKPEGQQPKPENGQPKGNKDNPPATPNELGAPPQADPTQDPLMVGQDREQWGNLPVHMQELFRAEGGDKVPARYRDWIDSYYRRLNDR
ncbi:MAG: hypothetical protein O2816_13105 [Planctomycetota bacterium]|nr:hypothetical protein [Planctomycetota bacterium]